VRKILGTANPAEAHLLAEALRQEGIAASVQGEWGSLEGPSVWIENERDAERADALVAEITAKQAPAPTSAHSGRSGPFVGGLLLGLVLGAVVAGFLNSRSPRSREPVSTAQWDLNGDGKPDDWARYDSDGRLVESSSDRNFDGAPDSWLTYDPPGVLNTVRYDQDFDRREDYWESYAKGLPVTYTADNDRNAIVDEWGRFENGVVVERNWSFANDRVADRRAFYRAGRKVREQYDRNRDGAFDETVTYDEFERVVAR
jgi:hypothetical protein